MTRLTLSAADRVAIERELCSRSLSDFAKRAWPILEPSTPLKWGWALDAICAHLEAVSRGEITRLLMNVPPGTMKSILTGVIWPAWEWASHPGLRIISTAHKQDLAIRDNLKCRRLVQSEWYQQRWPLALQSDNNAKLRFENDKTGFREAMAFASMTGARGDRVILDDPLSADEANSEAALLAVERTFLESLPTRVNNESSAIVVIMQRLHERDPSGIILDRHLPYTHLCLPMRFEPARRCSTGWFSDPRERDGELLFPERFPESVVSDLERTIGSYAVAGQLQQRPTPRGGGMFRKSWFQTIQAVPAGCVFVRGWDLAATEDEGAAATAGVLMARSPDGRFIIADVAREQSSPAGVVRLLKATADQDRTQYGRVKGSIPQDPGQAGKAQAKFLLTGPLVGHSYSATPESGDKETRALPFAAQAEAGNVYLAPGPWNAVFLDEIALFPLGKWKDQVDAASRAFNVLMERRGPISVSEEMVKMARKQR